MTGANRTGDDKKQGTTDYADYTDFFYFFVFFVCFVDHPEEKNGARWIWRQGNYFEIIFIDKKR